MSYFGSTDIRFQEKTALEKINELKNDEIHNFICNNYYESSACDELIMLYTYILDASKVDERYKDLAERLRINESIENIKLAKGLFGQSIEYFSKIP